MSSTRIDQLIRPVPRNDFSLDVAAFLVDRKARSLSLRTIEFYDDELRYLQVFLDDLGIDEVRKLTPNHLRSYLLHLQHRRTAGGLHAAYRAIKVFLRWWETEMEPEDWGNPIRKVKAPKRPQVPLNPVPLTHLRAMLRTCQRRALTGDRDRAILLCLLDTGSRASEFLSLQVGDVNLSTGAVVVRQGKGNKTRVTFLGVQARRELMRYLRHRPEGRSCDPLWVTIKATALTYSGLRQIVRRRAAKADVPVPSLHSFRRAFALLSLRSGADLVSLQRLLGHSDLSVLHRYLNQTDDDLRATHEKHGPVDHWL